MTISDLFKLDKALGYCNIQNKWTVISVHSVYQTGSIISTCFGIISHNALMMLETYITCIVVNVSI